MLHKLFSVFDSKTGVFTPPFAFAHRGDALRSFQQLTNDTKHQFCKFAADYTLFEIGEFDDQSGLCSLYEAKENLGLAKQFQQEDTLKMMESLNRLYLLQVQAQIAEHEEKIVQLKPKTQTTFSEIDHAALAKEYLK